MKNTNLDNYLSKSYEEAWKDYISSLSGASFAVWDHVILTASNEHQAEAFRLQIQSREKYLPKGTKYTVIPDDGGVRVGSGGATFAAIRWLSENGGWKGRKILVIHSGGDSRRVPQYSALGKLFSPVPHKLPDGRSSTLFDEFIIAMSSVPSRITEGMMLLSGDVVLLFNSLLIEWNGKGAAVISFKEDAETGKDHGVYLTGDDGNVRRFLHKQSIDTLRSAGAVNDAGCVDIDTGTILFGTDVLDSLYSLISSDGGIDEEKYRSFVNEKVRLSLYGDFQYPLAADSSLEQFYKEKPEGAFSDELAICRKALWDALRQFRLRMFRLAPAKFIHFGTTKEIIDLMCGGVNAYRCLGWSDIVNSSSHTPAYDSVISAGVRIGNGVYAEVSHIHSSASVGDGSVISFVDLEDGNVPSHVVVHGLRQTDGKFVCRIFGTDDNPKENRLFGKIIPEDLGKSLWEAPIYPVRDNLHDAVGAALELYSAVMEGRWDLIGPGRSLAEGFMNADTGYILSWNAQMRDLVAMHVIERLIDEKRPAVEAKLDGPLTQIQRNWLDQRLKTADYSKAMRLCYYVGSALGGAGGEQVISGMFNVLSDAILREVLRDVKENSHARIVKDEHTVSLPLRVNWGGGWSDTPPYCCENGGTVLNAAILLNGSRPVTVRMKKIPQKKIVFTSGDMDVCGEFTDITELQKVGDPLDPFVLQKSALLACGVIPFEGGDLDVVLERLGGGFTMDTDVGGVPRGSGLGTSSILAAACARALFEFLGIEYTDDDLYGYVLCIEQMMSTGGGWQDQVGGATDGIKFITSRPGLDQSLKVTHLELDEETRRELNERFCLVYTGQRRLARKILRDVVGRYVGCEPDVMKALDDIQRLAALMRFELERGNVDAFAHILSEHWEQVKIIDADSTNTLIDQIIDSVEDLIDGKFVAGAGGGGFLQMILKKGVGRDMLQRRLKELFSDTDINVWDCTLV